MRRRTYLARTGTVTAVAASALAGCLERLGFEEESAWRNPPLVEDRPDAVYVPAAKEEMGNYGSVTDGEYAISFDYTYPHRFWIVRGDTVDVAEVSADDTLHLMSTVWDVETRTVLPVDMSAEISTDDGIVDEYVPWPMLAQRMGFHYGDNVRLPDTGTYTARIRVGPITTATSGSFAGRLEEPTTLEFEFTYDHDDIHSLGFTEIDTDKRGRRDALALMDHGPSEGYGHGGNHEDHGGDHRGSSTDPGPPPSSQAPARSAFAGTVLGTGRSGDADFTVVRHDEADTDRDGTYLAVSARTPYNEVVLPAMGLRASVERSDEVLDEQSLTATLDDEFGYHYGATFEDLDAGEAVRVVVESPPQVTRHDGYETAFLEFEPITVSL